MPARTNEFQRLILTIEQLTAAAGATVEKSVLLEDLTTGARREVDVLVTLPGGPRAVRVGVECRDQARPADVTWIEQLRAKYDCLPVDRVVAVSRRGFTAEALAKARVLKLETLSLGEAEAYDWASAVRGLRTMTLRQHQFEVTGVTVRVLPSVRAPDFGGDHAAREIAYADGSRRTVQALVSWVLAQPFATEAQARAYDTLPDETSFASLTFTLEFPPVPGAAGPVPVAVLIDAAGSRHDVAAFVVTGECRRTVVVAPVEQASLGPAAVLHGRAQVGGTRVRYAAAQHEGGAARMRVTLENGGTVVPVDVVLESPGPPSAHAAAPRATGRAFIATIDGRKRVRVLDRHRTGGRRPNPREDLSLPTLRGQLDDAHAPPPGWVARHARPHPVRSDLLYR